MMTNAINMATTGTEMSNVTVLPTIVGNMSYTYGPTRTILGVPIDVFSYIFLGIAGAAPVVFIITVVVSMKCYSWQRRKRVERLRNVSQIGMELWEAERTFHINGKFQHAYDGPALATLDESPISERSESMRLKISNSNPNVFFKGSQDEELTVVDSSVPTSLNPIASSTLSLPATIPSINSEERRALECFDMIYEGLDSLSGTESLARTATFRYPHPLYDKTKNGFKLPGSNRITRRFSLKSFPSQLKVEVESHTLPARTSKRHPNPNHLQAHPNHNIAHTLSQMPQTLILQSPPVSVSDIASLPSPTQRINSPDILNSPNQRLNSTTGRIDISPLEVHLQVPGISPCPSFPPPPSTLPSLSPVPSANCSTPEMPPKPPLPEAIYSIPYKPDRNNHQGPSASFDYVSGRTIGNMEDEGLGHAKVVHDFDFHNDLESHDQGHSNKMTLNDSGIASNITDMTDDAKDRSLDLTPRKSWLHSAYSNPAYEPDS